MREQLRLLLQLQEIDSRVMELRASVKTLPEKLAPAKQDLVKLEAMLDAEKQQLAATESWRREQELTVQLEDDAIKKAKQKLQSAKNSKDYAAASRELENKKKSKSDREEEILKMMEALEKSRAEVTAHEADVSTLRQHIETEEKQIAERLRQVEEEAAAASTGRDAIASQVQPQILKRYQSVLRKRAFAVAPVADGTCQGCHMALPPQLNNVLARFDSIETCPRCARIVYRAEIFEQADEPSS